MNVLFHLLGWPAYEQDKKINTTPNSAKKEKVSDALIEEIRHLNQFDIELYEHAKALFNQQLEALVAHKSIQDKANENYYRSFKKHFPAVNRYRYDFRYAPIGSNWHVATDHPQYGIFRFMGPETKSYIDLPLAGDQDLILSFRLFTALVPEIIDSLTLSIGNTVIPFERKSNKHMHDCEAILPKELLQTYHGRVRLVFTVDQTLSPKELGRNKDSRKIGPGFTQIDVYPIEQYEASEKPVFKN